MMPPLPVKKDAHNNSFAINDVYRQMSNETIQMFSNRTSSGNRKLNQSMDNIRDERPKSLVD